MTSRILNSLRGGAAAAALGIAVAGCATTYGAQSFSGGYSEQNAGPDQWFVQFLGNGYTTQETAQTYWLYHCAEFTLSKGYKGFEILTAMDLAANGAARPAGAAGQVVKAAYFQDNPQLTFKPGIRGKIRMLPAGFSPNPERRIFDATSLKAALEPLVTGAKCGGNICPHVHSYLYNGATKTF